MATDSNALSESALQDLAERIEAADGPDREIDAAIYQMLNPHMEPIPATAGRFYDPSKTSRQSAVRYHISGGATGLAPRYTASLDEATTLVPGPDWEWSLEVQMGHLLHGDDERMIAIVKMGDPLRGWEAAAATPALALCAAALRARHSQGSSL